MATSRTRARASVAAAAALILALAADGTTAVELNLTNIVNATNAGSFLFVKADAAELTALTEAGSVVVNSTVPAPEGYIATRATEKGISEMTTATNTNAEAGAATPAEKPTASAVFFVSEDQLPARSGNSGRSEKYEFATMEAPKTGPDGKVQFAAFFVPGKKAADMSSTISGANQRYATEKRDAQGAVVMRKTRPSKSNPEGREVPVLEFSREFQVRDYVHQGVAGALVRRIK